MQITIPTDIIQTHLFSSDEIKNEINIDTKDAINLYTEMVKIRKFEEHAFANYDKMDGFLHLTIGQESIYAAFLLCLEESKRRNGGELLFDFIGSYRCHSLAYITGSPFQKIAYELLGRKKGMCKGKGGSMHLYNKNFYGGHGIVGAQVSLGTGLAFGIKYAKDMVKIKNTSEDEVIKRLCKKKAVFAFFGDGAANQGQVYESYNIALIYKLPIIFVIENNKYGMYTPVEDVSASDNFFSRWSEMRGIRIKSNNPLFILAVLKQIILKEEIDLPLVLQIDTYRKCGHSAKDNENYRGADELKIEEENDCIKDIQKIILDMSALSQIEFQNIEEKIDSDIKKYFEIASLGEFPGEEELFKDIIQ